jgi:hypothetical protein
MAQKNPRAIPITSLKDLEVAVSKTTVQRLQNYAALSPEFYTEAMRDLLSVDSGVAELVRSQTGWQRILPKIESRWKVYRLSKKGYGIGTAGAVIHL